MSGNPPKDTLGGASKRDVATAVAIGFMALFGVVIIAAILQSTYQLTISGQLDINLIWGTFIGIVISIMTWLGFKQGQAK